MKTVILPDNLGVVRVTWGDVELVEGDEGTKLMLEKLLSAWSVMEDAGQAGPLNARLRTLENSGFPEFLLEAFGGGDAAVATADRGAIEHEANPPQEIDPSLVY